MVIDRVAGPLSRAWNALVRVLVFLQPFAQFAARLYVGKVFFWSGLEKLRDWDTTLALFHDEYHVPLLPPTLAAYLGTAGEVGLPVLLVLGFGGRFAALGMFVVNLMAAMSLSDIAPAALQQHVFWGSLLAFLALWGPGRLAVENWLPWNRATRGRPAAPAAGITTRA
jgi:putative oxidoreductase